ncbi:hypothetical protein [Aquimarina algiphila]|nr:hypothetical protein [Aquimarina algiphila]
MDPSLCWDDNVRSNSTLNIKSNGLSFLCRQESIGVTKIENGSQPMLG